ncbi:MAG: hypothetical protein ACPG45_10825 [Flavobacteriaceae bacterium]
MNKYVVVSEKQKPLINRIATSFVFTLLIGYLFFFAQIILSSFDIHFLNVSPKISYYAFYLLVPVIASTPYMISLSQVKQIYFDLENELYCEGLVFGLVKFRKKWKVLPKISYVSTFYQASDNDFEVVLWSDDNRNIDIFKSYDWVEIFYLGYKVAKELKVEMYDAIDRNNKYWVDLNKPIQELLNNVP